MPRVFADRTAQLNATNKKCENENYPENPETNFTNPRRNCCTAQKRLCDHSPSKTKRPNPVRQFSIVCVRNCVSSNRTWSCQQSLKGAKNASEVSGAGIRLWRERVDHSTHGSPCALHHTVRDVLGGNRRIFRYVPRRANRPSLKAANAKPQREKY